MKRFVFFLNFFFFSLLTSAMDVGVGQYSSSSDSSSYSSGCPHRQNEFSLYLNPGTNLEYPTNTMYLSITSDESSEDDKYYEEIEMPSSVFLENWDESMEQLDLGNEFHINNIYNKLYVEQKCKFKMENDKNGYYSTISEISAWLDKYGIRLSFFPNKNKFSELNLSNSTNRRRSKFNSVFIPSLSNRHPHCKSVVGKLRRRTIAVRDLLMQDEEKIEIDHDDLNNLCQVLYRSGCWPLELTGEFLKTLLESWGYLTYESQTFAIQLAFYYRLDSLKSDQEDLLIPFSKISLDKDLVNALNSCRSINELTYKFTLAFLQKGIDQVGSFNRMTSDKKQKKTLDKVDFLDPITLSVEFALDGPLKEVLLTFFRRFSSLKENLEKHEYLYLFSNPFFVKILSVCDEYLKHDGQGEVVETLYSKLPYKFSTWEQLTTLLKQGDNYSDQECYSLYYSLKFYDLGGVKYEDFLQRKLKEKQEFLFGAESIFESLPKLKNEQEEFLLQEISNDKRKFALLKMVYEELFLIELCNKFLEDEIGSVDSILIWKNDLKIQKQYEIINQVLSHTIKSSSFNRFQAMDFYETIENYFLRSFLKKQFPVLEEEIERLQCFLNQMKELWLKKIPNLNLENISGDGMKARLALAFVLLKIGDEHANNLAQQLLQDVGILDIDIVDGLFDSKDKDVYVYGELTNNNDWLVLSSLLECFNQRGECTVRLQEFNNVHSDLFRELSNKKRFSFFEIRLFNILSSKSIGSFIEKLKKRESKEGKKRKKKKKNRKKILFPQYNALAKLKRELLSQSFDVFMDYCL